MLEPLNKGTQPKAQELITKITQSQKGIRPIHVAAIDKSSEALWHMGDLEGFLDDLSAIEVNTVFVTSVELSEEDFIDVFRPDVVIRQGYDKDADGEEIDLTTIVGELADYKTKIGETTFCHLRASLPEDVKLDFFLVEDWHEEFTTLRDEAKEKLREMESAARLGHRQEKENNEKALLEQLNALINDPVFCSLKTHRAMHTYATEKIEGLTELEELKVKQVIAVMADKIGLKKHTKSS